MTATVPDSVASAALGAPGHVLRNPGVVGIGVGSLLSDTGHEMAAAALPGFVASPAWGFVYATALSAAGVVVLIAGRNGRGA